MSRTLRTCNLCKQAEGDIVHGRKIKIVEYGVCEVCMEELRHLEKVYSDDFENRTGIKVEKLVPWPAFNGFSWPPYSDVIVSGWEFQKHEFGLAITEDLLLAGRRSKENFEKEAFDWIAKITAEIDSTEDYKRKMELRRDLHRWQKKLDEIEKLLRMGERPLPMISLELIPEMEGEFSKDWIKVKLKFRVIKTTFFNKKKEAFSEKHFTFSRIYQDAFDCMVEKVERKGGKVTRTGAKREPRAQK